MQPTSTAINKLRTNPNNPRTIRKDQLDKLVKSLREFPEMLEARPIVVDPDFVVLGGNMRLKAAQLAGLTEVPVYVATWEEAKHKEFIIKDNLAFGEWDWDMLANEWEPEELDDWGLQVWKPEDAELDEMPELPTGDREPYQQMTFQVHDDQAETIKQAISLARGALTRDEKYIFTKWLKEQGVKAKQINDATGSFMGSHYLTDKSQPDVPTAEKWEKFRHLVKAEVPQHIDDLINRHTIAEHQNDNANGNALCDICKAFLKEDECQRD
jgi:hypothetical protein